MRRTVLCDGPAINLRLYGHDARALGSAHDRSAAASASARRHALADRDWPTGDIPAAADKARLGRLVDHAFATILPDDLRETHALVVIHRGRLVIEHYGAGVTAADTLPSWSVAKSITQALVGLAVKDGLADIAAPAAVPEWQAPDDPRRAITLDQMLRMSDGLAFLEVYTPDGPSDTVAMLFGEGKDDVAHYAAQKPLAHAPARSGPIPAAPPIWWRAPPPSRSASSARTSRPICAPRLFAPLGMASPIPKFDAAGTFIGSSYCFATARDFARFGLLYLRDGVWDGVRLLPEGWVDYARTATWQETVETGRYGAHWWLDLAGPGSFSANGFQGQFVVVVPDRDLVIVRLGATSEDTIESVKQWIKAIAECFPRAG